MSSPEEAYEIAKEIQGGFTKEEFLEAAKALAEAADGDISDADLASAAGGINNPDANRLHESLTIDRCVASWDTGDTIRRTVDSETMQSPLLPPEVTPKVTKAMAI